MWKSKIDSILIDLNKEYPGIFNGFQGPRYKNISPVPIKIPQDFTESIVQKPDLTITDNPRGISQYNSRLVLFIGDISEIEYKDYKLEYISGNKILLNKYIGFIPASYGSVTDIISRYAKGLFIDTRAILSTSKYGSSLCKTIAVNPDEPLAPCENLEVLYEPDFPKLLKNANLLRISDDRYLGDIINSGTRPTIFGKFTCFPLIPYYKYIYKFGDITLVTNWEYINYNYQKIPVYGNTIFNHINLGINKDYDLIYIENTGISQPKLPPTAIEILYKLSKLYRLYKVGFTENSVGGELILHPEFKIYKCEASGLTLYNRKYRNLGKIGYIQV